MKEKFEDIYGMNVFNEDVMRQRLTSPVYKSLCKTMEEGSQLAIDIADVVANAMKDWAIEKGATHYTHWFQPMTGITAEKHDSFISPAGEGKVVAEFSGKELIKGEPDASSFPSGGLRATFEARGYTAWDPTSYAFVKDDTLYIPTAFCSYTGEVLDKKTPVLRSMEAINTQTKRMLAAIGMDVDHASVTVGAEQEYFLVDKDLYAQRKDLIFSGRTLFGARPPKGQELEDHYFGNLKERISNYMKELDMELWKLGVCAKTKHNEVAPAQHELAPMFTSCNMACDQNQLIMEMMKKVAAHHGLVCLLHEKPFAGVNGSGKHDNWSISAGDINLLKPGKDPVHNTTFLLALVGIIKAVHEYGDLLRVSVASAGNDHRLGANEAPPAIVSMFLGEYLTKILEDVSNGEISPASAVKLLESGVASLPVLSQDISDRNRTSPFAFTGNKFEFRMPGSSQSISGINVTINTIVAESFRIFADRLEAATDVEAEIEAIIKDTCKENGAVVFNGNNYSDEWVLEAAERGLPNYKSSVESYPVFLSDKSKNVFIQHGIFSEAEIESRFEIKVEAYVKTLNIEALTMLDMAKREILPSCIEYNSMQFGAVATKKSICPELNIAREAAAAVTVSNLINSMMENIEILDTTLMTTKTIADVYEEAVSFKGDVFPAMQNLRAVADELETLVAEAYWPFPTYADLLFRV